MELGRLGRTIDHAAAGERQELRGHRQRAASQDQRPARGADPRRRQHRPIATNKRSTSAAARRPPTAAQSAAQARRAARAPRKVDLVCPSLPRARAPQSERCHKPPQRSCLNRGAVAHHPLARAASAAPLARAREELAPLRFTPPHCQCGCGRAVGEDPVAEPRCARPAAAASNISISVRRERPTSSVRPQPE
jgi:hypothetical protein